VDAETATKTTSTVSNGKFIKEITSNRGHKIKFLYETCQRLDLPGTHALKQIEINKNSQVEVFDLTQGYFNLNNFDCSTQVDKNSVKLKLKSIQKAGENKHGFEYYNEDLPYPNRLSDYTDHWGYYSGSGGKYPADPTFGFTQGADKTPVFSNVVQGILKKVTYPTGGYTIYEYESNRFKETVNNGSVTLDGRSLHFDANNPNQQVTFTLPSSLNPASVFVKYECTSGIANPQFEVLLSGANYYKAFNGISLPQEFISIPPGQYTISVSAQNGNFPGGYFSIFWTQTNPGSDVIVNSLGGGLRIRTIKDFDGIDTMPKTRLFTYDLNNDPSSSSGRIFNKPQYSYLYSKPIITYPMNYNPGQNLLTCQFYVQSTSSNLPLSGIQYSNVLYTEVQERKQDENGVDLGYTHNTYSFEPDLKPYAGFPFTPATSYEWMSGLLTKGEVYKKYNSNYQLQQRTINTYNHNLSPPDNSESGSFGQAVKPNEAHALGMNINLIWPEFYAIDQNGQGGPKYPANFKLNITN
jgi:hypothetical protein